MGGIRHHEDPKYGRFIPFYRAPELAHPDSVENEKSQVYSIACIIYQMLTNIGPYDAEFDLVENNPFHSAEFSNHLVKDHG
jgi:serine/threonine protein kinase